MANNAGMGGIFSLVTITTLVVTRNSIMVALISGSHVVSARSASGIKRISCGFSSYMHSSAPHFSSPRNPANARMAFVTSPSSLLRRCHEQRLPTAAGTMSHFAPASFAFGARHQFHSTTMLMMAKKKKNGGKTKKAKPIVTKRIKVEGAADVKTEEVLEDADPEQESAPFIAEFASTYHAPVMPRECIDAMLQQGEWGEMLHARKERWRKKRSIMEAKRRRTGYYDNGQEEDEAECSEDERIQTKREELPTSPETKDNSPRLFIDGTLGGGGHSEALLQQLRAGDVLIGCDVDPEALAQASTRLRKYLTTCDYILDKNTNSEREQPRCEWEKDRPIFVPVQANFRNLVAILSKVKHPVTENLLLGDRTHGGAKVEFASGVNGMLLDLGVSSHQIDTSERGFAFMKDGPLDMRMAGNSNSQNTSILTAADICNEFDEPTLIEILRTYGDEPRAKRIVSAIVASRPLYSTTDLVKAIASVTPKFARQKRAGLTATSARVFQALRIVVNEEDGALKEVLEVVAPWALSRSGSHYSSQRAGCSDGAGSDGILAVLSYHSMEDKMAKRVIRDGKIDLSGKSSHGRGVGWMERDLYGNVITEVGLDSRVPFEPLAKPRKATREEVDLNSRSRSATLRVALRI